MKADKVTLIMSAIALSLLAYNAGFSHAGLKTIRKLPSSVKKSIKIDGNVVYVPFKKTEVIPA